MVREKRTTKLNDRSLIIIFQETKDKLKDQFDSVRSLDNKAIIVVSFSGVILSILFSSESFNSHSRATVVVGVCIFFSAIFSILSLLVRSFRRDPNPRNLYTGYAFKKQNDTLEALAGSYIDSYEKNESQILIKKGFINVAFIFIGLACLFILLKLLTIIS